MTPQTIEVLVTSPDESQAQDSRQTEIAKQNQVRYVPTGSGTDFWGPGSLMTFLLTGKDTGGAFFMAEISVPPGGGPPPHIHHREDETFYLLEGTLTIRVGENTITASPGDSAFLPRRIVHSFKNTGSGNARALVVISPAGLENYFAEVFEPAMDRTAAPPPPSKELIARALAASPRYGLELLPPA